MAFRPAAALLAAVLVLPFAACTPSKGAAVVTCETPMQAAGNPWSRCSLRVDAFDGQAAASFRGRSPAHYRHFETEAAFGVERGRVRVTVRGGGEPAVFTVEPDRPWQGRIIARLERSNRKFTVSLEPLGNASGFHATLRHRGVQRSMLTPTTAITDW